MASAPAEWQQTRNGGKGISTDWPTACILNEFGHPDAESESPKAKHSAYSEPLGNARKTVKLRVARMIFYKFSSVFDAAHLEIDIELAAPLQRNPRFAVKWAMWPTLQPVGVGNLKKHVIPTVATEQDPRNHKRGGLRPWLEPAPGDHGLATSFVVPQDPHSRHQFLNRQAVRQLV